MVKPKVFDCFCYFNEDLLLELRLRTLWDVVDVFVIVEATHTQTGIPKPLNFSKDRFAAFASKIRYVVCTDCPGGRKDPWANENFQRNEIKRGLLDAKPDDFVIISDLDEIPRPESISNYNPRKVRGDFQQSYYSYYLNNQLVSPKRDVSWPGSKITLFRYFEGVFRGEANQVRSFKSRGLLRALKRAWFIKFSTQTISNGGWHFTWVLSVDGILEKMSAMAHQENNRLGWRQPDYIQSTIELGRDLVRPERRYCTVPLDNSFPQELLDNPSRYAPFIQQGQRSNAEAALAQRDAPCINFP